MTFTIELKPETQRLIEFRAEKNGVKVEAYLEEFIEESMGQQCGEAETTIDVNARKSEWKERFNKWLESHKDKGYPSIPDDALRRENMYEDRF